MDSNASFSFHHRLESLAFEAALRSSEIFREDAKRGWALLPKAVPREPFDLRAVDWVTPSELVKLAVIVRALSLGGTRAEVVLPDRGGVESMGIQNLIGDSMATSRNRGEQSGRREDKTARSVLIALLPVGERGLYESSLSTEQVSKAVQGYTIGYLNRSIDAAGHFARLFVRETIENANLHGRLNDGEWPADTFVSAYIRRTPLDQVGRRQMFEQSVSPWELEWLLDIGSAPYLEIAVGDTGFGLTRRLGRRWRESVRPATSSRLERDSQIIEFAFWPYTTTRDEQLSPTDLWRPRGLFLLREELRSYGGWLGIRAGHSIGVWDFRSEQGQFRHPSAALAFFPGTVVTCRIALPVEDRIPRPRTLLPNASSPLAEPLVFEIPDSEKSLARSTADRLATEYSTFLQAQLPPHEPFSLFPIVIDCSSVRELTVDKIATLINVVKSFPVHSVLIGIRDVPLNTLVSARSQMDAKDAAPLDDVPGVVTLCSESFLIDWVDVSMRARTLMRALRDQRMSRMPRHDIQDAVGISGPELDEIVANRRYASLLGDDRQVITLRVSAGDISEYVVSRTRRQLAARIEAAVIGSSKLSGVYHEPDTQYQLPSGRHGDLFINVRRLVLGDLEARTYILKFLHATLSKLMAGITSVKRVAIYTETYPGAWLTQEILSHLHPTPNRVYRDVGPVDPQENSDAETRDAAIVLTDVMSTGVQARRMCESAATRYNVLALVSIFDFRDDPVSTITVADRVIPVVTQHHRQILTAAGQLKHLSQVRIVDPVTFEFTPASRLLAFPNQDQLEQWVSADPHLLTTAPSLHRSGRYNFYQLDVYKLFGLTRAPRELFPIASAEGMTRQEVTFGAIAEIVERRLGEADRQDDIILLVRSHGALSELRDRLRSSIGQRVVRNVRVFELPVSIAGGTQRFGGTLFDVDADAFEGATERLRGADVVFVDDGFISGTAIRWVQRVAAAHGAERLCVIGMYSRLGYFDELAMRYVFEILEPPDVVHQSRRATPMKVTLDCLWHLRTPAYNSFDDSPLHEVMLWYYRSMQYPLTLSSEAYSRQKYELLLSARQDPGVLSVERDEELEGRGAFKWWQVTLREELQLQSEHVLPALAQVATSMNRRVPDRDDALITVLAYEPDLITVGRMTAGDVNYAALRDMCLLVLGDSRRSSEFKQKALRVLWFQHIGTEGPYFDCLEPVFDALAGDRPAVVAAFFYLSSALARATAAIPSVIPKIEALEVRLSQRVASRDVAKLEAWRNCRALREIYRLRQTSAVRRDSFEDFSDFCALFLDPREWHPGSFDESASSGGSMYGTWVLMDRLIRSVVDFDESASNVEWNIPAKYWAAVTKAYENRIAGRMAFVLNRLQKSNPRLPLPHEGYDEEQLIVYMSTVTSTLSQLASEWILWSPTDRRNQLNEAKSLLERLQETAFDGPSRPSRAGSRLARLLQSSQTRLADTFDVAFREAETALNRDAPGRQLNFVLTEQGHRLAQFNELSTCVLGAKRFVDPILDNLLANVVKHADASRGSVSCDIAVTHEQTGDDMLAVVRISNKPYRPQNEDSAGVALLKLLTSEIGAKFHQWRDQDDTHVQEVQFQGGFLPLVRESSR